MLITQYYKIRYKVCHKQMKQQSVIKRVKGADNQHRDNENNRCRRIAKKTTKGKQRQKGVRGKEAIVKV